MPPLHMAQKYIVQNLSLVNPTVVLSRVAACWPVCRTGRRGFGNAWVFRGVLLLGVVIVCVAFWGVSPSQAKIYQWTDRDGTVHFTDDPLRIPEEYRRQFKVFPEGGRVREQGAQARPPAEVLRRARWLSVASVIDGDTVALETGEKVRYLGIDAPESRHPTKLPDPCGLEASEVNRQLVSGKRVVLEFDVERRDRYGRLLAYVFTDSTFVNAEMVRRGYARVSTFRPNVKYRDVLLSLQRQAMTRNRGLWGGC